jgi:hypothetical protein
MLTISIHGSDPEISPFAMGCGLIVWAIFEIFLVMFFVIVLTQGTGQEDGGLVFVSLFLLGWTFLGGYMVFRMLWILAGQEIIEVTGQSITISYKLFGLGSPEKYQAEHIWGLRVSATTTAYDQDPKRNWLELLDGEISPPPSKWWRRRTFGDMLFDIEPPLSNPLDKPGFNTGQIAFNYDGISHMIRFGNNISKAEARQIVTEIQQRFPQYRDKPIST